MKKAENANIFDFGILSALFSSQFSSADLKYFTDIPCFASFCLRKPQFIVILLKKNIKN